MPGSVPLGAVRFAHYDDVEARLEPGASLVLYTDGVVERPGVSLDVGLELLREAVCRTDCEPVAMCDTIIRDVLPGGATHDDAALLVGRALPLADPLELRLPADVDTIPSLRRVLGRWLREADASSSEIEEITLACSEACANAIEHAYAPGPAALEVTASVSKEGETVIGVRDFGSWRPARGAHRGRGMVLMKGLMDSVDVDSGDGGTTVRLARRLEARRLSANPDLRLADRGSVPVAHLSGELDVSSANTLRERLLTAVENQDVGLVIDLSDATYVDSAGVNLLFEVAERLAVRQLAFAVVYPEGGIVERVSHARERGGRGRRESLGGRGRARDTRESGRRVG